jgi:hypothetical protein
VLRGFAAHAHGLRIGVEPLLHLSHAALRPPCTLRLKQAGYTGRSPIATQSFPFTLFV